MSQHWEMPKKPYKIFWVLSQGWLTPEGGVVLGLADDGLMFDIILWLLWLLGNMLYFTYIYIMYISQVVWGFWVFLCMHPRHDDDYLETAKNVLAVRLV